MMLNKSLMILLILINIVLELFLLIYAFIYITNFLSVMAFRKTYRSSYFASVVSDGFGESKFVTSSNVDGVDVQSRVFETPDDISSHSLPLVDLSSIIASGQVIKGNVSFAPSDPALIESRVNNSLAHYIDSHVSNNSAVSSSSASDSDSTNS